jgi:16S rRNA (guanine(966)-N(2))-methyltransferase RsmD
VTAGYLKGLTLTFPKTAKLRPTQNRVKESIFNIIGNDCSGKKVLDLCCGTASLGIEALSRGAEDVICVDTVIHTAKENIKRVKQRDPNANITVIKSDAPTFIKRFASQADIIFLDPPYKIDALYASSLNRIFEFDILTANGIVVCESSAKNTDMGDVTVEAIKQYQYGDTLISVFGNT